FVQLFQDADQRRPADRQPPGQFQCGYRCLRKGQRRQGLPPGARMAGLALNIFVSLGGPAAGGHHQLDGKAEFLFAAAARFVEFVEPGSPVPEVQFALGVHEGGAYSAAATAGSAWLRATSASSFRWAPCWRRIERTSATSTARGWIPRLAATAAPTPAA